MFSPIIVYSFRPKTSNSSFAMSLEKQCLKKNLTKKHFEQTTYESKINHILCICHKLVKFMTTIILIVELK